jgi:hypothetical protein
VRGREQNKETKHDPASQWYICTLTIHLLSPLTTNITPHTHHITHVTQCMHFTRYPNKHTLTHITQPFYYNLFGIKNTTKNHHSHYTPKNQFPHRPAFSTIPYSHILIFMQLSRQGILLVRTLMVCWFPSNLSLHLPSPSLYLTLPLSLSFSIITPPCQLFLFPSVISFLFLLCYFILFYLI